ncbi:MoaD/ThiS family protein [Parapedobacter sp. 2B3]|uniref:MoaD/ThiS family protein n=1 Tax=Parapedobacter sp. 2B3 TaxID=3342381 RepID=UPI0035B62568
MDISILAFGIVKEFFGGPAIAWELQGERTVARLKEELEAAYPDMKKLRSYLVAVNDEYAEDGLVIRPGDEIAIIPPVSGG